MPRSKIRWGILGTSLISETLAQAIKASDFSELLAIGSRSHEKCHTFSERHSIQKTYTDYHALLNDTDIDAVYIGLPNHLHLPWILHAAKAGKHILCEKPFVISQKEVEEAYKFVKQQQVYCIEALMYRYHPLTQKLQEIVQSGCLGEIRLINALYAANIAAVANPTAGGSIRNLGCYPISLIRLLLNAEPQEITAIGRHKNANHQAAALLRFNNGTIASVSTADDMDMIWQFDIYGSKGCLKMLTNPWMPNHSQNKIYLHKYSESPIEMNIAADKPLYTYQVDVLAQYIANQENIDATWHHSIGNVIVLEKWLAQVMYA